MLEDLSSIRVLALRDNNLEDIPEEITEMKNLIRLDLGNNGITQ
jgi:Leucine-rich repeat (LRR) protein